MTEMLDEMEIIHTGIDGAGELDVIKISNRAKQEVNKIRDANSITPDFFLRLATRSMGCSGMNYLLGFDSDMEDSDSKFEMENFDVVIDNKALFYFMGVTLDYIDGADGSGFVFSSEYSANSCGCSH